MASAPVIPQVGSMEKDAVASSVSSYMDLHDDSGVDRTQDRKENYEALVNGYYDLATDFYEWGWGQSFHFAVRRKGENFYAGLARHEHWLAAQMQLKPGMKVLDVGCGVGGPAREICRFSGAQVVGLNNNAYQIKRANVHTEREALTDKVSFVKGDFMKLPFDDNSFDAVYQIEATAHAPSKVGVYSEILRVLKPGGVFGSYEWCLTKAYNGSEEHRAIKKGIEEGDGLPDIATCDEVVEALQEAGYEVEVAEDRARQQSSADLPWYTDLEPRYSLLNFQHTEAGHYLLAKTLAGLERLSLVAKGTHEVQEFLHTAAVCLVRGGVTGTFTPAFFTLARKVQQA